MRYEINKQNEKETQRFMKALLSKLNNNSLQQVDEAALRLLEDTFNLYLMAQKDIRENGITITSDRNNISISPSVTISRNCITQLIPLLQEFGCTVKSRSKLSIDDVKIEASPLDRFIETR